MITINVDINKPLTQNYYDKIINHLQFHQLTCSRCGISGGMSIHAYYTRFIKSYGEKVPIKITRVICTFCHATHAILPSSIVPKSQLLLMDHIRIAKAFYKGNLSLLLKTSPTIDSYSLRYILNQFLKYWEQRLISASINLLPTETFIKSCFVTYSKQFMQINSTPNILFSNTT